MNYDLSHLTQSKEQDVWGPVQDDEALLLFATIKVMKINTVFEIGGLNGYSATNFLKAVGLNGKVFTCDNHIVIHKDVYNLTAEDLHNTQIDLIFFDCHEYEAQLTAFNKLLEMSLFKDKGVIALHDTNTHPPFPSNFHRLNQGKLTPQGYVHQPAERQLVNYFAELGYHALCFHTNIEDHNEQLPFRHGITLMKKFEPLLV
jgi:predicted O-methyltransferase YrrM